MGRSHHGRDPAPAAAVTPDATEPPVEELKISMETLRGMMDATQPSPPDSSSSRSVDDGADAPRLQRGDKQLAAPRLTKREMVSLAAIADTLLPCIPDQDAPPGASEDVRRFFRTSASTLGTPAVVGEFIKTKLQHPSVPLLRLSLWFLSTWVGTLALCGLRSLSPRFPFVRAFPDIDQRRREELLRGLATSRFNIYRMFFKSLKFMILLFYFTQVDENNRNPIWPALDYCGPDPDFVAKTAENKNNPGNAKAHNHEDGHTNSDLEDPKAHHGPLHGALIDLSQPRTAVTEALARAGIRFTTPRRRTKYPTTNNHPPSGIIRCDAVVVGSGSGGGVVAGVLATSGYKVVVLEKGPYTARADLTLLEGKTMDTMYEGAGMLATDDLGVTLLAGSTVGGGSAVNWSGSIRTPDHVLREWCDGKGLEVFGSRAYREAQEEVCGRMGVQEAVEDHGFGNDVLREGCQELGYPVKNIPRNSPADHYCGWCCFGCKDGRKMGTSETWLVDAVESGNGAVLPDCRALRVIHSKNRGGPVTLGSTVRGRAATGVVFEHRGCQFVVESKVVVVACGALNTPGLLKRSGLRNKHIGRNLHVHPSVMAWGTFPADEEDDEDLEAAANVDGGASVCRQHSRPTTPKKSYQGGIMTAMSPINPASDAKRKSSSKSSGIIKKLVPKKKPISFGGHKGLIQTPALHPGMFSALMPWVSGANFKRRMTKYSRTAHIYCLVRDKGTGEVEGPGKKIAYRLSNADEENLQAGIERILRLLAAAGAEEIGTHNLEGRVFDVKSASYHELEQFVKEESRRPITDLSIPLCSAHQMGTCRMGASAAEGAVDGKGETWEVEGLFVADTSVFPTALGINPMVTVMAIAHCTAKTVAEVLRRRRTTAW